MRVQVAYVGPGVEALIALDVAPGAVVADAVAGSHLLERISEPPDALAYAIFGRRVGSDTPLADGDRIEITRPLRCDPKLVRRHRATLQADATKVRRGKG